MEHNPAHIIQFLNIVSNLKSTKRTGWIRHGVPNPESIGDHMHRMSVLAMLIQDPALDRDRCIKMAIVHDIAESIAGDITPNCGVSKEEKFKLEADGIQKLCSLLAPASMAESEIRTLWHEYEACSTPEAALVKDLDKFEMIAQAYEYEKKYPDVAPLQDFFRSTKGVFQHPQVKAWVEQLYKQRKDELGFDV
ncbi:HD domain-domain-containing protein [Catenaria anguillulae PL171]|uniref:5'-deoxynucleotidase n=1 Tax=Catenaria anguillulae PL171 TaxID=765915 RepID=A0A1Y2I0E4_9FUNG|nr:HD domain-domain-containing protein [Catenaria anguillulae PL171]